MPTLSAAVEICLTIMTDAAAAMHILVVISIMMFGPNARNYVLAPADPAEKPCYGVFSTPAGIVGASLVFKFLLSCFALSAWLGELQHRANECWGTPYVGTAEQ